MIAEPGLATSDLTAEVMVCDTVSRLSLTSPHTPLDK